MGYSYHGRELTILFRPLHQTNIVLSPISIATRVQRIRFNYAQQKEVVKYRKRTNRLDLMQREINHFTPANATFCINILKKYRKKIIPKC
jgi:hypothetical protein